MFVFFSYELFTRLYVSMMCSTAGRHQQVSGANAKNHMRASTMQINTTAGMKAGYIYKYHGKSTIEIPSDHIPNGCQTKMNIFYSDFYLYSHGW